MKKKPIYLMITFILAFGLGLFIFLNLSSSTDKDESNDGKQSKEMNIKNDPKKIEEKPIKEPKQTKKDDSVKKILATDESIDKKTNKIINQLTLEQKIGQMFVVGFTTDDPTSEPDKGMTDMIKNKHVGGVILFNHNMKTKNQVRKLNNRMQSLAMEASSLPLFVAIDQEGGDVVRMQDQYTKIPSQQTLGKTATKEKVEEIATNTATELKDTGFNVNFAPVLDMSDTDSRSFGTDPKKTYEYSKAVIDGFSKQQVTGALKHFPGHGRSNIDPHFETSSVDTNQEELLKSDIYPFKQMIDQVDNNAYMVMVTHIKYPSYDKEMPASLSSAIIQDLLRDKLGYEGIIATDDLEMDAVRKYYSFKDMGVKSVEAGADLLLVCHDYNSQVETYNGLLQAVKDGKVSENRIDESVTRIIKHKLTNEIK